VCSNQGNQLGGESGCAVFTTTAVDPLLPIPTLPHPHFHRRYRYHHAINNVSFTPSPPIPHQFRFMMMLLREGEGYLGFLLPSRGSIRIMIN
jgi:hypothetical protein